MRKDPGQLAAINTTSNAVVRAGAGAGKTSVLVERYIRLVLDGTPVRRILTLTFTRKAAAEMHERIYRELARRAATGDDHLKDQVREFDNAVISTLDSFCAAVARSGCRRYGLPPTFTVDELAVQEFCEDLALRFILQHGGGTADARPELPRRRSRTMLSLLRLNRFAPLLHDGFAGLARDHFLVSRPLDLREMARLQREHLISRLEELAQTLGEAAGGLRGLDTGVAKCVAGGAELLNSVDIPMLTNAEVPRLLRSVSGAEPLPQETEELLSEQRARVERLSGLKKNCGSSRKPEVIQYKAHVDTLKAAATEMSDHLLALLAWHEVVAAADLAEAFQAIVLEQKRRTGILSYHDVVALAISVLRDDEEIRSYYKRRFRAIMIDEFQDNNDEQKELLFLLAERLELHHSGIPAPADLDPGKLFFVGDEKQSIYRFRGADVTVFKRLSEDLGGEAKQIVLGCNYRSEPGLIRFFNSFFSRIFTEPEVPWEARFDPLTAREPVARLTPSVQIWYLQAPEDAGDYLSNDEAEAWHIARSIREAVEKGLLPVQADGKPDGTRPAVYGDIAVLMRSSTIQKELERMLRIFGIPYVAQTARSLFLEAPMNDIYNLLQLVLYPDDRVALAAYLRSPLVGMGDNGLVRVLLSDTGLFGDVEGLDDDDTVRYELARERYESIAALADTQPVTELVHQIWHRWGYRNHLLRAPEYHAYLEHFDYIYELASLHEKGGLAEFLSVVRQNRGRNQRLDDLNIVREEGEGVRLLTVHKSKGLEFPVVIVANAGNRGRSDRISDAPFYHSRTHGIVFNTASPELDAIRDRPLNPIYRAEHERAKAENTAELRRLLYVASTRAEAHLIYSGQLRGEDRSLMSMIAGPFAAAESELAGSSDLSITTRDLEPVSRPTFRASRSGSRTAPPTAAEAQWKPPAAPRAYPRREFTVTSLNAAAVGRPADSVLTGPEETAPAGEPLLVDSDRHRDHADLFGTFVHYCVEQLGRQAADVATLQDPQRVKARLRPELPPRELERYLREGVTLARRFLDTDLWALADDADSVVFELPFLLRVAGCTVRGKIDLLIELANRTVLVDFKTDRELRPGDYTVQLHLYRMAAAAITGKPAESCLHHLRTGRTIPMTDELSTSRIQKLIEIARLAKGDR